MDNADRKALRNYTPGNTLVLLPLELNGSQWALRDGRSRYQTPYQGQIDHDNGYLQNVALGVT